MAKRFHEYIQESEVPVLVDFWAPWCGPCHMIAPELKKVAQQLKDRVKVIKVNVDEQPHIAAEFGIRGIPTLILFKDGAPVWRRSGAMPAQMIIQEISPYLPQTA